MVYSLSDDTWGGQERQSIEKVVASGWFTMGEKTALFEQRFAETFGARFAVMVNSGSSANLLAVAALVYSGKLKAGDEVLVPAVSWSTTYFPLSQFGLSLRFVDIDKTTLNMDLEKLEQAVTERSKAVFAVNLLGNPNDFDVLEKICKKHQLFLLEDNCEAMGAEYKGKKAGTFGLIGTFSMFYSHHICTMEGGVAVTDDEELYQYMLAVRAHGWTRNLPKENKLSKLNSDAFYESFHFVVPGFNLRPLEIEAAAGLEQLKKLDGFIENRRKNAAYFQEKLGGFSGVSLQRECGKASWFGFAILLEKPWQRDKLTTFLRENGIEIRPIVAGNFTRQEALSFMPHSVSGALENADYIHENGFFVGNHSVLIQDKIEYLAKRMEEAIYG